jgi:hypothetical protein
MRRIQVALLLAGVVFLASAGPATGAAASGHSQWLWGGNERRLTPPSPTPRGLQPDSGLECISFPGNAVNRPLDCPGDNTSPTHEPSLTVDPRDPSHIVVGANDFPGGACCNSEFYASFDGGRSWAVGDIPFEPSKNFAADPSVAFDLKHRTVVFASTNYLIDPGGNVCEGDVVVSVSSDGGLSWSGPNQVAAGQGCLFQVGSVAHDKPWITVDNNPASPYFGRVYVTTLEATCFQVGCDPTLGEALFTIVEAHSDDGGSTWTAPRAISGSNPASCTAYPVAPVCSGNPASWAAVSPDGSVHVAFFNLQGDTAWEPGECCESQFLVVNSTDGGATWSDPVHVVSLEDGTRDYPNCAPQIGAPFCTLSHSELGVFAYGNLTASPLDGSLYLVFSDNRNGVHDSDEPITNADVFLMTSTDGGQTWTGPDPVTTAPGDQFMPYAAVDPTTGDLGVVFYDRSADPPNLFDVTLVTGTPGHFTSNRITTESSHLDKNLWFPAGVPSCPKCASWVGEYIGLAYDADGQANLAWTDLRRRVTAPGMGNGYTENIFYARIAPTRRAAPASGTPDPAHVCGTPLTLAPASGLPGSDVRVGSRAGLCDLAVPIAITFTDAGGMKTSIGTAMVVDGRLSRFIK